MGTEFGSADDQEADLSALWTSSLSPREKPQGVGGFHLTPPFPTAGLALFSSQRPKAA